MCQFIETIQINDGCICNLAYHTERFNKTRRTFWNDCSEINLADFIRDYPSSGKIKCRIVYAQEVENVSFSNYSMREVNSLKLIVDDQIDYTYKSADRDHLNRLFLQKENADDILIVRKGYLTDTSIANIALFDGTKWYTPSHPLLKGTKREELINKGVVEEKEIKAKDIYEYSKICIFNSMIDFNDICFVISTETVHK